MAGIDRRKVQNLVESNTRSQWFEIKNISADEAEVRIYDEISLWGVTAEDFADELDNLTVANLTCRINCPGGSVFDGITIHNTLIKHPARVTTIVDGIAASAASFIVQAGDERIMMQHAQMMVHDAQGVAVGDANTMREMADLLDKQNGVISRIYAERSEDDSQDEAYYRNLMAATTWLTDEEAVENGLADSIQKPQRDKSSNNSNGDESKSGETTDNKEELTLNNGNSLNTVDWGSVFETAERIY